MTKPKAKPAADVPFAVKDWPATRVVMRKLVDIHPYDTNPRTHPPEQIKLIAQSMMEDGVFMPILVDEKSIIIAGHGRRLGALENKFEEYPVVIAHGWSEEKKRAVRIKDNQLGLLSGWDEQLLNAEMHQLQLSGYDMPLLGFSEKQLSEMIVEPSLAGVQQERQLTPEEQARLNIAWRRLTKDWKSIFDRCDEIGCLSTSYMRGSLAVYFVNAQLHGGDIPRAATLPYTMHRVTVIAGDGSAANSLSALLTGVEKSDSLIQGLQFVCGGRPTIDALVGGSLPVQRHRAPMDFPIGLARDLINEFCPDGGNVLDPCHGWGGRMVGYLLSKAGDYTGFDVDERTSKGVFQIYEDLKPLCIGKKHASVLLCPFEDSALKASSFDFALTSPPYFDTEKYGGELSSWKRYATFDAWVVGFYRPLIAKTAAALKPGAAFALQIGNQRYPLEQRAREIAQDYGMSVIEKRTTDMVNNSVGTAPEDGEIILILRRDGGAKKQAPTDVAKKFGEPL